VINWESRVGIVKSVFISLLFQVANLQWRKNGN
jgi:hypothetical protein